MENGSDTPDFILAEFLANCLASFDETVVKREKWYHKVKEPFDIEGMPPLEVLVDKIIHIGVPLPSFDYNIRRYVTELPIGGRVKQNLYETFRSACDSVIDWGVKEGFFDGE